MVRVAHLFSFLCCVFGGVCVTHLFSFLCCVFGGVRVTVIDCTKIGKANDFNTVTFLCSDRFRKVQLPISFLIVMIFSLKLSAQNSV